MKKVAIALVLIVGIVVLVFWLKTPEVPEVTVATVEKGAVETLVANTRAGTIRSCQRSKLSFTGGGTVAELLVKNGDRVEAGQVLMQLWNEDQKARLKQAQAQQAAAGLARQEVCDGAARDEREAKRAQSLARKKMISDDALDTAQTRSEISAHSCQRAKVEEQVAESQVALQASLLEQTKLIAPFAGIVAEINGEVGEFVTPSPPGIVTPPAVDLIADNCLYVRAPIDEVDAAAIRVDMPARITLDAFRGRLFKGVVTRIAPYVQDYEKQARTVDVEARFDPVPADISLLVGYSADIEVIIEHHEAVTRVPTEAIFEQDKVLKLGPDNVLAEQHIKAGLGNWTWTEVREGLSVGDRIVLSLDTPGIEAGVAVRVAP